MNADGHTILACLQNVAQLRQQQASNPTLAARVQALKAFQHARFAASYADLQHTPAQAAAARFFLDELYGPHDFSARDAQFARIVPALVRLFPAEIVATVRSLAELHALSEDLDLAMARALDRDPDQASYRAAWQQVGRADARQRQIALMQEIGQALARYTRKPLLRHSLRLMRAPARAAGLADLQRFLETGFDTFARLPDAHGFLALIARRERQIAGWLLNDSADPGAAPPGFA